ncbi:hypothetical protein AOLI_G00019080 [Acnodon oligacanthus]
MSSGNVPTDPLKSQQHLEYTPHANAVSVPTKGMVSKSMILPVLIYCQSQSLIVSALINSGAEGNFIHDSRVREFQIPIRTLQRGLKVSALDGEPVGAATCHNFLGNPRRISYADKAFQDLKDAFTLAPILIHPNPDQPFVVEVDASETRVGAVLSQRSGPQAKLHAVAFYLHKMTSIERNFRIGNRELLAVKLAFEEWCHWQEGANHPFTVLTYHKNLEYLRTAKRLNARQAPWSLFFQDSSSVSLIGWVPIMLKPVCYQG